MRRGREGRGRVGGEVRVSTYGVALGMNTLLMLSQPWFRCMRDFLIARTITLIESLDDS